MGCVYIENDISALYLLGSKKWWSKKFLVKFGIESCDLTRKEAEVCFDECKESIDFINKEIEEDKHKKDILIKLINIWG